MPQTPTLARAALFDLAVNRALSYALSLAMSLQDERLEAKLEPWYQQTRFAYRIALGDIIKVIKTYPGETSFWQGGKLGSWHSGTVPRP